MSFRHPHVAWVVLAVVVVAALGIRAIGPAASSPEENFTYWMNQARDRNLELGWRLRELAEYHSHVMANRGYIFHVPYLEARLSDAGARFTWWGDNVGVGRPGKLHDLFVAFMASPAHRENILDPRFTRVGVGVVERDGFAWVTTIFVG